MTTNQLTTRDRLHLRAFHAFYNQFDELPTDERFLKAICLSSDEALGRANQGPLVRKWVREHGKKIRKRKEASKINTKF